MTARIDTSDADHTDDSARGVQHRYYITCAQISFANKALIVNGGC